MKTITMKYSNLSNYVQEVIHKFKQERVIRVPKKQKAKYKIINIVPELTQEERSARKQEVLKTLYKIRPDLFENVKINNE